MTRKYLIAALLSLLAVGAYGRHDWYDAPITIQPGICVIDAADVAPSVASIHVRAAADPKKASEWGIIWSRRDTADYMAATLSMPAHDMYTAIYDGYASISVTRVSKGEKTVLYSSQRLSGFDINGGYNSLKVVCADGKTSVIGGHSVPSVICVIDGTLSPGEVAVNCDATIKCQRISTAMETREERPKSTLTTLETAMERIAASRDAAEGVWEYLDRNTDADKANVGGRYRLLTVRDGDAYDIIYLSGATLYKDSWRPMDLKGRMRKTIFKGNYDMEWYTADGLLIDEDTYAQLSDDGAILTLRFPVIDAEIRLRRLVAE